jgi:transcriptional regulator with XRE-family HTH domain
MKAQEKFGEKLRTYRTQQGMSQEQLALKADIDRTYIASVENGRRNVSIQTIHKFLKAIDIPFSEFFSDFTQL